MQAGGQRLAEALHTPVRFVEDVEEITDPNPVVQAQKRASKGWYDIATGEVVVVLANCDNVADVEATIFHEAVGHKGLRELVGDEQFDRFLDEVYSHAGAKVRAAINELARRNGWDVRLATEEYIAGLAERGFEDMDAEEQTFWGRVRRMVMEFLSALFEGRRIPASVRITDNEIRWMLWESYRRRTDPTLIGEARAAAMRRTLGTGRFRNPALSGENNNVENNWEETRNALSGIDTKNPNDKTIAQKDSLSHAEAPRYVPSRSDAAKVQRISESLRLLVENLQERGMGPNEILYEIAHALGISDAGSGSSNYVTLNANGRLTTVRVSNHSATTRNFGQTPNNVGLVIKTRNHNFRDEKGTDYVEFMYYGDQIAGDATRQREVIEGLRHYIETGSFEKMPQPDVLNTSGAYLAALPSKKSTIRFRANYGSAREEYDERVRNKKVLDKTTGKVKIDAAGKALTRNIGGAAAEAYFDSMRSLNILQEAIANESKRPIEEFEDAYRAENAMSSANTAAEEVFRRTLAKDLLEAVGKTTHSREEYHELMDYMIAKHGLERNAYMRAAEAAEIQADTTISAAEKTRRLAEVAHSAIRLFRASMKSY